MHDSGNVEVGRVLPAVRRIKPSWTGRFMG